MKAKDVPRGKSPNGKLIAALTRKNIRLEEKVKKLEKENLELKELIAEYQWVLGD